MKTLQLYKLMVFTSIHKLHKHKYAYSARSKVHLSGVQCYEIIMKNNLTLDNERFWMLGKMISVLTSAKTFLRLPLPT